MATTNAVESVNSVMRDFTRDRKPDPNAASMMKMVYLAIYKALKERTRPIVGWKAAFNHFAIVYRGSLPPMAGN